MMWIFALIAALAIAGGHALPVREAGMSIHNALEVLLTLASFALAGLCLGRIGSPAGIHAQAAGLFLGFYATVVSATLRVDAANNVDLVLIGAAAAMVGGTLGASVAPSASAPNPSADRSLSSEPASQPIGWRPIGG